MATATTAIEPNVKISATKLLINGQCVNSTSGKTFPTINPATGEVITQVAEADAPDVDKAVSAARAAFEKGAWRKMSASQRGNLMYKLADLIEKNTDELAQLEALDNGKPYHVARASFWSRDWAGQSFMAIGMKDPVLGAPAMRALRATIRNCPPPLELAEAGHFTQEAGVIIVEKAMALF